MIKNKYAAFVLFVITNLSGKTHGFNRADES